LTRAAWPLLVAAAGAAAQNAPAFDPVVAHFLEYRAAIERNDLVGAEVAGAAALAASEQTQSTRTAVLALNLANVRLDLGEGHDALTPARTAHGLATSSADAGVDPKLSALTLGRAKLAAKAPGGGEELLQAIATAEADPALGAAAYHAAVELGQWALRNQQPVTARSAWSSAANLSSTTSDPAFSRASALIGIGIAIFLQPGRLRAADAQEASDALTSAGALLKPAAYAETPVGGLTAGQVVFAQALAWRTALYVRLGMDGGARPEPPAKADATDFVTDQCNMRPINRVQVTNFLRWEGRTRFRFGAVVAHLAVSEDGTIGTRTIAAVIPPDALDEGVQGVIPPGTLRETVQAKLGEVRIEKDPDNPASCRMPSSFYFTVPLVFE
jgi:hypothetical protein